MRRSFSVHSQAASARITGSRLRTTHAAAIAVGWFGRDWRNLVVGWAHAGNGERLPHRPGPRDSEVNRVGQTIGEEILKIGTSGPELHFPPNECRPGISPIGERGRPAAPHAPRRCRFGGAQDRISANADCTPSRTKHSDGSVGRFSSSARPRDLHAATQEAPPHRGRSPPTANDQQRQHTGACKRAFARRSLPPAGPKPNGSVAPHRGSSGGLKQHGGRTFDLIYVLRFQVGRSRQKPRILFPGPELNLGLEPTNSTGETMAAVTRATQWADARRVI